MKKNQLTLFCSVVIIGMIACKQEKKMSALEFNEKIAAIVAKVDSSRDVVGDTPEEKEEESIRELKEFQLNVKEGLNQMAEIEFKTGEVFLKDAKSYIQANRNLSDTIYPFLMEMNKVAKARDLTEEEKTKVSSELSESIQKVQGALLLMQKSQEIFAKKNHIKIL